MAAFSCSAEKNQIVPRFEHSDRISLRRKALFPDTDDDDDTGDLGPMSPLSDISPTRLDDYIILDESDQLEDESLDISTYSNPSACETPSSTAVNGKVMFLCSESPSKTLLTPHDTSTSNTRIPRLSRKSQSEDSDSEVKSESKNPKARTALFPEVMPLSVKSFYPKSEEEKCRRVFRVSDPGIRKPKNKSPSEGYSYLRNRRNSFGIINKGIGKSKIKKPKNKHTKISPKKVMMSQIEGEQLVGYMKDLKELTSLVKPSIKPVPVVIKEKEIVVSNADDDDENKENISPVIKQHNKFFKSNAQTTNTSEDAEDIELPNIEDIIYRLDTELEDTEIQINNKKRKFEDVSTIADMLLSPTSQMCDMTSEMAINSPKRAKLNINAILEGRDKLPERRVTNIFNSLPSNESSDSAASDSRKLFPIFYPGNKENVNTSNSVQKGTSSTGSKKWNKITPDQAILDAGQKRFGLTQCPTCEMIYFMGNLKDEEKHNEYHFGVHVFKFKGWKNERIVGKIDNDRIIQVNATDPKIWTKKVRQLLSVINRELGFHNALSGLEDSAVYIYVKNKNVVGLAVAQPRAAAHKNLAGLDSLDCCSRESYPIMCCVQRLWVAEGCRRTGIATALLDSVRKNFSYGYVLRPEDVAISPPTDAGKAFAKSYFKSNGYLICLT